MKLRNAEWIAAGAVVILLTVWLYSRSRDERIRREAVAKAEVAKLTTERARADSLNAVLRDSLRAAQSHTNTIRVIVDTALAHYVAERGKVDTLHAAQPLGTPVGFVVVPVEYVHVADSVAALVPKLTTALDTERAVSTRRIAELMRSDSLSRAINAQLQIQIKAIKPHISDKLKWAGIGGVVALGVVEIFKN
jgi:hypothetical protein